MTQATTWSVPLSGPVPPDEMADRMDKSFDALLSAHSGSTRPTYAVAGTMWLSTATAGKHKYYWFDGTSDRLVITIDTATGAVSLSDGVVDDGFLKKSGGAMTGDVDLGGNDVRKVATLNDGPLSGFRNKIINGDFDIWQRLSPQTASGYGSDDRWNNEHNGSTKTASQQTFAPGQTVVPGNPRYFARTVVTSVAGANNYVRKTQRIEGVRTLAGKTVTLTLHGAADASRNIAVEFVQNFGTGGSPSAAVTGIGSQLLSLTTTAAKKSVAIAIPSISGKTLGSNDNDYLELVIWLDAGTSFNARTASLGQQSGTFDISHVSLVEGDATQEVDPFSPRHIQQERALCHRYFYRGGLPLRGVVGANNQAWRMSAALPVRMRASPTLLVTGSIFDGTATQSVTTLNAGTGTLDYVEVDVTTTGTALTIGRPALLLTPDVSADAEL